MSDVIADLKVRLDINRRSPIPLKRLEVDVRTLEQLVASAPSPPDCEGAFERGLAVGRSEPRRQHDDYPPRSGGIGFEG